MANKLTKLRVCYPLIKASADINSNTINVLQYTTLNNQMSLIVVLGGKVERVRSNKSRDGKEEDNRTADLTILNFSGQIQTHRK